MFNREWTLLKRIASYLCLIFFLVQQVQTDRYVWAMGVGDGVAPGTGSSVPAWSAQQVLSSLQLPEELGRIQETFFSPQASSSGEPLIVYLQSAHANYDSESHVKELIHYFQEKYALPLSCWKAGKENWIPCSFNPFPKRD